jgi:hypothetical protein
LTQLRRIIRHDPREIAEKVIHDDDEERSNPSTFSPTVYLTIIDAPCVAAGIRSKAIARMWEKPRTRTLKADRPAAIEQERLWTEKKEEHGTDQQNDITTPSRTDDAALQLLPKIKRKGSRALSSTLHGAISKLKGI